MKCIWCGQYIPNEDEAVTMHFGSYYPETGEREMNDDPVFACSEKCAGEFLSFIQALLNHAGIEGGWTDPVPISNEEAQELTKR